jgi:hypothetical protein
LVAFLFCGCETTKSNIGETQKEKALPFNSILQTQNLTEGRLLVGLACKWEDLTSEEQEKALQIGYKKGDKIWKTSDPKGTSFKIPGGTLTITALEVDGAVELVLVPKGIFYLAPVSSVREDPLVKITHVIYRQKLGGGDEAFIRGTVQFECLNKPDQDIAQISGYKPGDEVLFYYGTRKGFEIKHKSFLSR